jgi:hypothetical protein
VTLPDGLRAGWEREQARNALVDEAAATEDGRRYLELLRAVDDPWEWDLVAALLSTRLALWPDPIAHRRAKHEALARERARRRAG